MTNAQIILTESIRLMESGILSGSGVFGTYTDAAGNEIKVELPEPIHTFAAWKAAGYSVKKGQHAIAAFPVWKYSERRRDVETDDDSDGDQQPAGRMFMKKAFFFKFSQVEKITT